MLKRICCYIKNFFANNLTDDLNESTVWSYIGDHFAGIDQDLLKKNELKTYKQFRKEYVALKKESRILEKNAETIKFVLESVKKKYGTLTPEEAEAVIKVIKERYKL